MKKRTLIIIGAGAAGLAAAEKLSEEFDVTILEAQERVGGRINTLRSAQATRPVEAGAEFIHGDLPITLGLAEKAGVTVEKIAGNMFSVSHCDWTEQTEMIEGWDELLGKMESIPEDMTLDAFLETYYNAPDQEELRRHTRSYAAGFDLADPIYASVKSLYREWTNETGDQYRLPGGYDGITNYLKEQCESHGCRILMGKKVAQISWKKNLAAVQTADGETFKASKVVITLPAGIMKKTAAKAAISFTPAIDNYIDAFRKLGYGSVVKIVLRFYESFWQHRDDLGFLFSEEMIPTWWTQLPDTTPVLTGWLGGPAAVQWSGIDDATLLDHALQSLAKIFRLPLQEIKDKLLEHYIFNWHTVETSCGAYSYETPQSAEARAFLKQPIEETLYFAGEALYEGAYPGTVEAALTSGVTVADDIIHEKIFQEPGVALISSNEIS